MLIVIFHLLVILYLLMVRSVKTILMHSDGQLSYIHFLERSNETMPMTIHRVPPVNICDDASQMHVWAIVTAVRILPRTCDCVVYLSIIHPLGPYSVQSNWCCLSSLLGYCTQSQTGRHSDTGYQQAGTHFANLGRMTGSHPHLVLIQQLSGI